MLRIIALILLTIFLYIWFKKKLSKGFKNKKNHYERLNSEYGFLSRENMRMKTENADLGRTTQETIALYDITKDICKTLDEEKIFSIFREEMNRYIEVGDCKFLKADVDLSQYQNYAVLPLRIDKHLIGHLIANEIKEQDKDKFHILAQQFMLAIKRALLYKKVQELTITDDLTQVFNRRYFLARFHEEMERSKKFKLALSFLMLDIDHFKECNDHFGHLVGDTILREVTKTIKEKIRQIDFIGRYGGEELSIVLAETDKARAPYAAERIRQAIESNRFKVYDEDLKVTVSIGISTFPDNANNVLMLIEKADQALYQAKQTGRNKVCAYLDNK